MTASGRVELAGSSSAQSSGTSTHMSDHGSNRHAKHSRPSSSKQHGARAGPISSPSKRRATASGSQTSSSHSDPSAPVTQQKHIEQEERRVKDLTESVLYDFLPSAMQVMLPQGDINRSPTELDAQKCRAVAGAALCASALLNAPPGFLEFLLCVPWYKLSQLHASNAAGEETGEGMEGAAQARAASIDKLVSNLHVSDAERRLLVNSKLVPELLPPLLEFLYRGPNATGMPPLLQLTPSAHFEKALNAQQLSVTLEMVAAVLDGATPLHCAAIRGNPSQVDHFLFCGSNPSVRTAAGDLPIELLPVCGELDAETGHRVCRCMGPLDQEVWECRSKLARSLVAYRSMFAWRSGLLAWLYVLVMSVLCLFGQWGRHLSLHRVNIAAHVSTRRHAKQQEQLKRVTNLMSHMRSEAQQGHVHLSAAKQEYLASLGKPPPAPDSGECAASFTVGDISSGMRQGDHKHEGLPGDHHTCEAGCAPDNPPANSTLQSATPTDSDYDSGEVDTNNRVQSGSHSSTGGISAHVSSSRKPVRFAEAASKESQPSAESHIVPTNTSVDVVRKLQQPQQGCGFYTSPSPYVTSPNAESENAGLVVDVKIEPPCEKAFLGFVRAVSALQSLDLQGGTVPSILAESVTADSYQTQALEDEQADLFCCWAESAYLKFRFCSCTGCTALAVQAVRMAHIQTARLLSCVEQQEHQQLCSPMHYHHHFAHQSSFSSQHHSPALSVHSGTGSAALPAGGGSSRWRAVGQSLARVVYSHICLLMDTEASVAQPCKSALWRAQQCLKEWSRLVELGLTPESPSVTADVWAGYQASKVEELLAWTRHAESDICIVEAMLGSSLAPSQPLFDALEFAVVKKPSAAEVSVLEGGMVTLYPHHRACLTNASHRVGDALGVVLDKQSFNKGGSTTMAMSLSSYEDRIMEADFEYELKREVTEEVVHQIDQALTLACFPSPHILNIAKSVYLRSVEELAASICLRDVVAGRSNSTASAVQGSVNLASLTSLSSQKTGPGVPEHEDPMAELAHAIAFAERFPRLAGEVEAARELQERLSQRSEASEKLEAVVEAVRRFTVDKPLSVILHRQSSCVTSSQVAPSKSNAAPSSSTLGQAAVKQGNQKKKGSKSTKNTTDSESCPTDKVQAPISEWLRQLTGLEAAIETAKASNVGVSKAKRLFKDLTAQVAAAEAVLELEAVMAQKPAGSAAVRSALIKAEAAATAVGGGGGAAVLPSTSSNSVADILMPLIQAARQRQEAERVVEALHKVVQSCQNLTDLPRLEVALLNMRKMTGAEGLDPGTTRAASHMLMRLNNAAGSRAALEAALRNLPPLGTTTGSVPPQLVLQGAAEAVQLAIEDAEQYCAPLHKDKSMMIGDATPVEGLLFQDVVHARESLTLWRLLAAAEVKLERALHGHTFSEDRRVPSSSEASPRQNAGSQNSIVTDIKNYWTSTTITSTALQRVVQECASAGAKVGHAKRVIKLMQGLEAAVLSPVSEWPQLPQGSTQGTGAGGVSPERFEAQASLIKSRLEAFEHSLPTPINDQAGTSTPSHSHATSSASGSSDVTFSTMPARFKIIALARHALRTLKIRAVFESLASTLQLPSGSGAADVRRLEALRLCISKAEAVEGTPQKDDLSDKGYDGSLMSLSQHGAAVRVTALEVMEGLSLSGLLLEARVAITALEEKMRVDAQPATRQAEAVALPTTRQAEAVALPPAAASQDKQLQVPQTEEEQFQAGPKVPEKRVKQQQQERNGRAKGAHTPDGIISDHGTAASTPSIPSSRIAPYVLAQSVKASASQQKKHVNQVPIMAGPAAVNASAVPQKSQEDASPTPASARAAAPSSAATLSTYAQEDGVKGSISLNSKAKRGPFAAAPAPAPAPAPGRKKASRLNGKAPTEDAGAFGNSVCTAAIASASSTIPALCSLGIVPGPASSVSAAPALPRNSRAARAAALLALSSPLLLGRASASSSASAGDASDSPRSPGVDGSTGAGARHRTPTWGEFGSTEEEAAAFAAEAAAAADRACEAVSSPSRTTRATLSPATSLPGSLPCSSAPGNIPLASLATACRSAPGNVPLASLATACSSAPGNVPLASLATAPYPSSHPASGGDASSLLSEEACSVDEESREHPMAPMADNLVKEEHGHAVLSVTATNPKPQTSSSSKRGARNNAGGVMVNIQSVGGEIHYRSESLESLGDAALRVLDSDMVKELDLGSSSTHRGRMPPASRHAHDYGRAVDIPLQLSSSLRQSTAATATATAAAGSMAVTVPSLVQAAWADVAPASLGNTGALSGVRAKASPPSGLGGWWKGFGGTFSAFSGSLAVPASLMSPETLSSSDRFTLSLDAVGQQQQQQAPTSAAPSGALSPSSRFSSAKSSLEEIISAAVPPQNSHPSHRKADFTPLSHQGDQMHSGSGARFSGTRSAVDHSTVVDGVAVFRSVMAAASTSFVGPAETELQSKQVQEDRDLAEGRSALLPTQVSSLSGELDSELDPDRVDSTPDGVDAFKTLVAAASAASGRAAPTAPLPGTVDLGGATWGAQKVAVPQKYVGEPVLVSSSPPQAIPVMPTSLQGLTSAWRHLASATGASITSPGGSGTSGSPPTWMLEQQQQQQGWSLPYTLGGLASAHGITSMARMVPAAPNMATDWASTSCAVPGAAAAAASSHNSFSVAPARAVNLNAWLPQQSLHGVYSGVDLSTTTGEAHAVHQQPWPAAVAGGYGSGYSVEQPHRDVSSRFTPDFNTAAMYTTAYNHPSLSPAASAAHAAHIQWLAYQQQIGLAAGASSVQHLRVAGSTGPAVHHHHARVHPRTTINILGGGLGRGGGTATAGTLQSMSRQDLPGRVLGDQLISASVHPHGSAVSPHGAAVHGGQGQRGSVAMHGVWDEKREDMQGRASHGVVQQRPVHVGQDAGTAGHNVASAAAAAAADDYTYNASRVCHFYLMGGCVHGDKCRFEHPQLPVAPQQEVNSVTMHQRGAYLGRDVEDDPDVDNEVAWRKVLSDAVKDGHEDDPPADPSPCAHTPFVLPDELTFSPVAPLRVSTLRGR
ncbi:hypothetical protein CEUSTIGMA_g8083.t1 [Chlamydomonas eustigma]|uniref:C3H1-type domain-containing protein n=1 Tax=Chlamydomonas eustigma TaxID=1157962 RepID=A0A250XC47_9CHLO|nr:hypothetical protein CEUSTIGMA_g8083.t1 [Chlamydomonas eustigma]|eukprot:GAX80648.1 hypothetical protein CEUSTIGMA_g8083.t1 [Chlamydomonas eustigma]